MCGISGIIAMDSRHLLKRDEECLQKMLGRMDYRGPDGSDYKLFGSCQFGMVRLAIIDVSSGQQPISNESDDVWVVMNGEIYNYIELREELVKQGHRFKTNSDTEVIVHLYEEYGETFVNKLNGMFAIFLYDHKNEKRILYRDHMGIKPLFYTITNGRLFFSSDLSGLAETLNAKISEDAIISFLGISYVPKPGSIYEGIVKMMPGHYMSISAQNTINLHQYWKIEGDKLDETILLEEAKERLHNLLLEANAIQLRSDVGFAISLSGGVDSSVVLAYASQTGQKDINTISMGYEGKSSSKDIEYAEMMARKYGSNHVNIQLRKSSFFEHLDELIPRIDEPISDSALIPNYIISKEARKRGIKVLLSGAGGDELFKGYNRYFTPDLFSTKGIIRYPGGVRNIGYQLLKTAGNNNNIERIRSHELSFASDINGLNFSFLKKITRKEKFDQLIRQVKTHYHDVSMYYPDFGKSRMLNDSSNYLVDNILSLSDKATMAASVEGRFPLIDYRIVELAFSLPALFIFQNGKPKDLLKQVVKPYVPHEILYRAKEGFNAPIEQWFGASNIEEIKSYIIGSAKRNLDGIIDIGSLKDLLKNDKGGGKNFENIYNLYFLNKWMDQHVK